MEIQRVRFSTSHPVPDVLSLSKTDVNSDSLLISDLESIRIRGLEPGSRGYKHTMMRCVAICGACAAVSVVAVVMEVYALMALQFCDGEDLMPLYWSTWTMMQVGSLIAIFGIILAVFNGLRGRNNP